MEKHRRLLELFVDRSRGRNVVLESQYVHSGEAARDIENVINDLDSYVDAVSARSQGADPSVSILEKTLESLRKISGALKQSTTSR